MNSLSATTRTNNAAAAAAGSLAASESSTRKETAAQPKADSFARPVTPAGQIPKATQMALYKAIDAIAKGVAVANGFDGFVLRDKPEAVGWAVYGPQAGYITSSYEQLGKLLGPYVVVANEASANRMRREIIEGATIATHLDGVDRDTVEAFVSNAVGVSRYNALSSPDSEHYFHDAARLKGSLDEHAGTKSFAVLRASFGSGAYGFSGPFAGFINKEAMTLDEAKDLLKSKEDSTTVGQSRIVPASLMASELTSRHGGILAGTNYPCNEIERFMANGGNLDKLTVLGRKSRTETITEWTR